CALRDPPAGIPPHPAPDPRLVAQKHSAARPQYLPVLRDPAVFGRVDPGPCCSAFARRVVNLGEPRCLLPSLQPAKGKSSFDGNGHEVAEGAAPVYAAHQQAYHADDWPIRPEVAQVPVLLRVTKRNISDCTCRMWVRRFSG